MRASAAASKIGQVKHCRTYRDCNSPDCIFYEGADPCWTRVSPFKMRRRPSALLKGSAEHCSCLSAPCTECPFFEE